ncbi:MULTISPECIES: ABC transporter ATP-binding protein [Pseudonocardia]|uniref:ABC transporter ATP-binding protein n=2 Tax=Pseudonocardia TaxID=1847 RepID=A0ABQ0S4B8_9PSEU|nr:MULTISPECIES: ATP-binding cassette domain-containing protein [Pseudonocardia]OSY38120.1 putative ABC transporter ATP-binding protein YxlF [Pseudonocardia autotrophica]TDN75561.1 ABC-2 type transport system ATP-binding protein [Pseudonocardia autotrophica]BBF99531.1 ABC transporter ATP-binding protein [Pseudonocardia autotrophica]GEC27770.1 ABC transporter ATP-binding protein [Pseudonocardia saturnea]
MLAIEGLDKRFGTATALEDVTFEVRPGELFGFVGGNGAGKTTTMRIVLGVLEPDAGSVSWRGAPVDAAVRRRIGYLPEERGLYPKMRVVEQLVYLARLHGVPRAAAVAAAEHWTERLGLAGRRADEVQKLSLGNQQRVQLCAALVHDPELLVLDEPFSGLDPTAVDTMSDVLRERAATGTPVIFSSHQLELVERLCDRVGIISAGRMVAVGSVGELRSGGGDRYDVTGPPPGWADGLAGVRVLDTTGDRTRVELVAGTGDQELLTAALAAGPVRAFGPYRPPLTELYRDAVADRLPGGAAA